MLCHLLQENIFKDDRQVFFFKCQLGVKYSISEWWEQWPTEEYMPQLRQVATTLFQQATAMLEYGILPDLQNFQT